MTYIVPFLSGQASASAMRSLPTGSSVRTLLFFTFSGLSKVEEKKRDHNLPMISALVLVAAEIT